MHFFVVELVSLPFLPHPRATWSSSRAQESVEASPSLPKDLLLIMDGYSHDEELSLPKDHHLKSVESYPTWSRSFERTLVIARLDSLVEMLKPGYRKPSDAAGLARWERSNLALLTLMEGSVDASILAQVDTSSRDVKVIWEAIERCMEPQDSHRLAAMSKLLATKCSGPKDIRAYTRRHELAVGQLEMMKYEIDPLFASSHFVNGLPDDPSYLFLTVGRYEDDKLLSVDQLYVYVRQLTFVR